MKIKWGTLRLLIISCFSLAAFQLFIDLTALQFPGTPLPMALVWGLVAMIITFVYFWMFFPKDWHE